MEEHVFITLPVSRLDHSWNRHRRVPIENGADVMSTHFFSLSVDQSKSPYTSAPKAGKKKKPGRVATPSRLAAMASWRSARTHPPARKALVRCRAPALNSTGKTTSKTRVPCTTGRTGRPRCALIPALPLGPPLIVLSGHVLPDRVWRASHHPRRLVFRVPLICGSYRQRLTVDESCCKRRVPEGSGHLARSRRRAAAAAHHYRAGYGLARSDLIFAALRVSGVNGRSPDERSALDAGVIGLNCRRGRSS